MTKQESSPGDKVDPWLLLHFIYSLYILISQYEEMWKISEIEMAKVTERCI